MPILVDQARLLIQPQSKGWSKVGFFYLPQLGFLLLICWFHWQYFQGSPFWKKCWIKSMADASSVSSFCGPVGSSHAGGRFISTTGSCHWNENVHILVQFVEIVLTSLTSLKWTWLSSQSRIFPLEFFHILVYLVQVFCRIQYFLFPFSKKMWCFLSELIDCEKGPRFEGHKVEADSVTYLQTYFHPEILVLSTLNLGRLNM